MFGRVRCHYCGSRQPYSKSVRRFECTTCQALNFFDDKGNVTEVSADMAASASLTPSYGASSRSVPVNREDQDEQVFCRVCLQNQHFYNEALANYLPDERDRRYRQFERDLPRFKKELEQRYPLICTACATRAQQKINRADYYALTTNASLRCSETRARKGHAPQRTRESWDKIIMRRILGLIGAISIAGLSAQIAYHLYGILFLLLRIPAGYHDRSETYSLQNLDEPSFQDPLSAPLDRPSLGQCVQRLSSLSPDLSCYDALGSMIPRLLILAACLLWYNPGLKQWFNPSYRIESVNGQRNYFCMQLINLCIRTWVWWTVSYMSMLPEISRDRLLAMHGFCALFTPVAHYIAGRNIVATKWTIKGHLMPKPEEQNVLGVGAGPAPEAHMPETSGADPFRYLRTDNNGSATNHLKQRSHKSTTSPSWSRQRIATQEPTPDYSDDEDAMDVDTHVQPRLQPSHTYFRDPNAPPLAITDLSRELTAMEASMHAERDRQRRDAASKLHYTPHSAQPDSSFRHQPSFALPPKPAFAAPASRPDYNARPFQGSLPPAPMSMGRRLRNPIVPVLQPAASSSSSSPPPAEPDFFQRMAKGLSPPPPRGSGRKEEEDVLPPVRPGTWTLPQDVRTLGGLEERFGDVFRLDDPGPSRSDAKGWLKGWFG